MRFFPLVLLFCLGTVFAEENAASPMRGTFSFAPSLDFVRHTAFDATNQSAEAVFQAGLVPGNRLAFTLANSLLELQAALDFRWENYSQPVVGELRNAKQTLAQGMVGLGFFPTPDLKLSIRHFYEQALIVTGVDESVNDFRKYSIPSFALALELIAFQWQRLFFFVEVFGQLGLSVKDEGNTIRRSNGGGGKIWTEFRFDKDWSLSLGGVFTYQKYSTHIVEQSRLMTGGFAQINLALR